MPNESQTQITMILQNAGSGDAVPDQLLPLVYDELRRIAAAQMAREAPGQTLQPTALVHEAYLRLIGGVDLKWDSRAHFFSAAARSMRQILINRANSKKTEKHGGNFVRHEFDERAFTGELEPDRMLTLDDALRRLEALDERKANIVMLRYFAGLSINDAADALGISPATVKREWNFARAWLQREMIESET